MEQKSRLEASTEYVFTREEFPAKLGLPLDTRIHHVYDTGDTVTVYCGDASAFTYSRIVNGT